MPLSLPQRPRLYLPLLAFVLVSMVFGACTGGASPSPAGSPTGGSPAVSASPGGSGPASASASLPATPTKLVVGLGYIPNVQFAQFYYAQQKGLYRNAGLEVTFNNQTDTDVITLIGQGKIDVGIADGTSVIPAVANGFPVRYVATIYATFPNIVYTKATSGITTVAGLKGKKLGTPGKYGSSWIMLQALLGSVGLKPADLSVQLYPDYGQGTALAQGAVDAATGFSNNEPVQLELSGTKATVFHVDQVVPLPGNGLIAGVETLDKKTDALKRFAAATLQAEQAITADPQVGLDAAVAQVPDLGKDPATQLAVLNATIATWSSPYTMAHGAGSIDKAAWTQTVTYMSGLPESGLTGPTPTVDRLVDERLLTP